MIGSKSAVDKHIIVIGDWNIFFCLENQQLQPFVNRVNKQSIAFTDVFYWFSSFDVECFLHVLFIFMALKATSFFQMNAIFLSWNDCNKWKWCFHHSQHNTTQHKFNDGNSRCEMRALVSAATRNALNDNINSCEFHWSVYIYQNVHESRTQ